MMTSSGSVVRRLRRQNLMRGSLQLSGKIRTKIKKDVRMAMPLSLANTNASTAESTVQRDVALARNTPTNPTAPTPILTPTQAEAGLG